MKNTVYGESVSSGANASIDYSNASEGYVIVKFSGAAGGALKARIIKGSSTYVYDITAGVNEVLPFTQGNGTYTVQILEGTGGNKYALAHAYDVTVNLRDSLLPFLYSNQYVNYEKGPNSVDKAEQLAASCATDVDVMKAIFEFVTSTLTYDKDLARTVKSGYIPKIDSVLSKKKGNGKLQM